MRLDERVIGRTPLEYDFEHYGQRRLSLYSPGYRTHSERLDLDPPWHAEFPWDLFTEVLIPLGLDDRVEHPVVRLEPDDGVEALPADTEFLSRAHEVRAAARAAAAGTTAEESTGPPSPEPNGETEPPKAEGTEGQ